MKLSGGAGFAVGCVFSLTVTGAAAAYAATGGNLIIGKANKATTTTSLTNTRGTALALASKAGTAPLKVNSATKVGNLNADKLDGIDSSAFARTTGGTGVVGGVGQAEDLSNPPDGVPDAIIAVTQCPAGSKLVGGGSDNLTGNGFTYADAPGVTWGGPSGTWIVVSTLSDTGDADADSPANVDAYAICYNPKGAVAHATRALRPQLSAQQRALIATRLDRLTARR